MGKATEAVGKVVSTVLGVPDAPKPPKKVAPPAPMPDEDDEAIRKRRNQSIAEQSRRSGRVSTVLSDDDQKLGG